MRIMVVTRRSAIGSLALLALWAGLTEGRSLAAEDVEPATQVVEHAFGTTEIPTHPKRVVTLGWTDVEDALALGVVPVGTRYWFEEGLNPWAAALVEGEAPVGVDNADGGHLYERIVNLEPDLIYANGPRDAWVMDEDIYQRLSAIAPTVGPMLVEGDGDGPSWDAKLRWAGTLLGRRPQAEAVIERVAGKIAALRAAHPDYEGKTIAVGFAPGLGNPVLYPTWDARVNLLLQLGFVPSDGTLVMDQIARRGGEMSLEQVNLMEADLLFLYMYDQGERTAALDMPIFSRLAVVRDDRVIWMPEAFANALTFGTALSIEQILDDLPGLVGNKLSPR